MSTRDEATSRPAKNAATASKPAVAPALKSKAVANKGTSGQTSPANRTEPAINTSQRQRSQRAGIWLLIGLVTIWWVITVVMTWQRPIYAPIGSFDHVTEPIPSILIDVNAASAAELRLLPGIGPMLAERIVSDRAEHGPFASLDDLQRVFGIGPRTVEGLADHAFASPIERVDSGGANDP